MLAANKKIMVGLGLSIVTIACYLAYTRSSYSEQVLESIARSSLIGKCKRVSREIDYFSVDPSLFWHLRCDDLRIKDSLARKVLEKNIQSRLLLSKISLYEEFDLYYLEHFDGNSLCNSQSCNIEIAVVQQDVFVVVQKF